MHFIFHLCNCLFPVVALLLSSHSKNFIFSFTSWLTLFRCILQVYLSLSALVMFVLISFVENPNSFLAMVTRQNFFKILPATSLEISCRALRLSTFGYFFLISDIMVLWNRSVFFNCLLPFCICQFVFILGDSRVPRFFLSRLLIFLYF